MNLPALSRIGRWKYIVLFLWDILLIGGSTSETGVLWEKWWRYHGISGPKYWGLLNPEWRLCTEGRRQSPINVDLKQLLYDPTLEPLHITSTLTPGLLSVGGNDVSIDIPETSGPALMLTSGPLAYRYRVREVKVHFSSEGLNGSEHTVNGLFFPIEVQLIAYNVDLYANFSEAETAPHGLAAIAILGQNSTQEHRAFNTIAKSMKLVRNKAYKAALSSLDLPGLIPNTSQYITYEGSQTQPGCHETVTWILLNKPLFISNRQLRWIRSMHRKGGKSPQLTVEHNRRPIMKPNQRPIRTNIHRYKDCHLVRKLAYEVNKRYADE